MKRVKFRGKPTETFRFEDINTVYSEDEFVYGNLIFSEDTPYIVGDIMQVDEDSVVFEFCLPVKPETVGQSTGKVNKNGIEIFEGDKLLNECDETCIVKWDEEESKLIMDYDYVSCSFDIFEGEDIEIIGTIHDKPKNNKN